MQTAYALHLGRIDLHVLFLKELMEYGLAELLVGALLLAEHLLDLAACLGGGGKVQPFGAYLLALGGKYLNLVTALEFIVDGLKFVVHLGAYAVGAHIGVDGERKVQHRTALGHGAQFALGGEYEYLR